MYVLFWRVQLVLTGSLLVAGLHSFLLYLLAFGQGGRLEPHLLINLMKEMKMGGSELFLRDLIPAWP